MELEIAIDPGGDVLRKLNNLSNSLLTWDDTMRSIGTSFVKYFSSVPFASRGSVYGSTWADYKTQVWVKGVGPVSYETWKADKYSGKGMLMMTGKLMNSFDFLATSQSVAIINKDVEKFKAHQLGINHPQRVIMALNENRRRNAMDIMIADVRRKVSEA